MANVGLSIVEGVANGASAYRDPSKRNIGLLGQFKRGVALKPTKITSLEEFNTIFGGQSNEFYGPGFVRSIFKEAGSAPVNLYIARVTGTSAVAQGVATFDGDPVFLAKAAYKGNDDAGTWANGIEVTLYAYGSVVRGMFTLTINYGGKTETYNYPTVSEIQEAVNKVSKYISISFDNDVQESTASYTAYAGNYSGTSRYGIEKLQGVAYPWNIGDELYISNGTGYTLLGKVRAIGATYTELDRQFVDFTNTQIYKKEELLTSTTLAGGTDATVTEGDFYPDYDNKKGLACFEGYDIQIIATTEFHSLTMARRLNAFLEKWGSPIGVINLPLNSELTTAELYADQLQTNGKSFLAGAYYGWVKVVDDNGNPQLLPSIAPILGAGYLRTPYTQGDFIHIPPAGTDSVFNYVTEVIPERLSQAEINKCVQQLSCNYIGYVENVGYYVGSSRTYSTNDLYCSIHIRQQTSYYLRVLLQRLRFMEQKPNTPELKREALVELNRFFKNEYDNGALERSVSFEDAYQGICDMSNNPAGQDRKLINIDVLWIPTECAESIAVSLQRNDGVLITKEA